MNLTEIITHAVENSLELEDVEILLRFNGYYSVKRTEYDEDGFVSGYALEVVEGDIRYSFFFDWQTVILCVDMWSFVRCYHRPAPHINRIW